MRKVAMVGCFLVLCAISAAAANYPKAELFGGYQFTHLEGGPNANGWNFAVNGNFSDSFGITADLASAYATESGVNFSNYTSRSVRFYRCGLTSGTRPLCTP